jgi:HprK-related kinase A
MNVGDLSLERFAAELAGQGVAIRWGPFTSRIVSRLPELAAPIHLLYADFPIEPPGGICDFHVCLRPRSLRLPWSEERFELLLDDAPAFQPFSRRFALAMLEWGLNWCVYGSRHRFLVIHAAVVERDGRALLLPGRPGAGKSTLCAALVLAGWRLLSDELTLVDLQEGRIWPLARPISLKNDAIQIIRDMAPDAVFGPPAVDTRKGTVAHMQPPSPSVRRSQETAVPQWIVMPRFVADQALQLDPISKANAFWGVADNSINYEILGEMGFTALVRLIDECRCYTLTHRDVVDAVAVLDGLWRKAKAPRTRSRATV